MYSRKYIVLYLISSLKLTICVSICFVITNFDIDHVMSIVLFINRQQEWKKSKKHKTI